jgi:Lon protease-like protein
MPVSPMFPLGSVLLPGGGLPLRIFEPRYRLMMEHCVAGDRRFGVVLIERGSEVGGGELRTDVGTVAEIVQAHRFDDGRWAVGALGVGRIRVHAWLPDDPYPRAEVEELPEDDDLPDPAARAATILPRLRTVLAIAAELGLPVPPATIELSEDPVLALWQAGSVAPIGPFDRQRLLVASGPGARADLLEELLVEQEELLRARLAP